MKLPRKPPVGKVWDLPIEKMKAGMSKVQSHLVGGRYVHWDKLRYKTPPEELTHDQWWAFLKFRREVLSKELPLEDKEGRPFCLVLDDPVPEMLHTIDLGGGGQIGMPDQITNPDTRDQYYVHSLIDEAITSSQLEGATTTRLVAKEMIRTGRPPRDRSEQMILNNFHAMKAIGQFKNEPLTPDLVFKLHRIVTEKALDKPDATGRLRRPDEDVRVESNEGVVFHEPPSAYQLERRMKEMCDFANEETPDWFLSPILRSIILHFWLAYDHPFVDGNGRTARALFYWSMLRHKYWLCEFVSISHIIHAGPVKYGRAFLYTETDENDLTYFVLYHLHIILRAIRQLHAYIERKGKELRRIESELRGIEVLNHRQRALISHALRHPNKRYTIQSHQTSHNVVYQTARTDLLDLRDRGLLVGAKVGKAWYFTPAPDMVQALAKLSVFSSPPIASMPLFEQSPSAEQPIVFRIAPDLPLDPQASPAQQRRGS